MIIIIIINKGKIAYSNYLEVLLILSHIHIPNFFKKFLNLLI